MADDTPSWLQEESSAPSGDAIGAALAANEEPRSFSIDDKPQEQSAEQSNTATGGESAVADAAEEKDLPQVILYMRLANMGAAIVLVACSIVVMASLPSISNWVLAAYATCGGMLVCCQETQLKFVRVIIAVNFGFLFNAFYRFIFYCLMSSICWAYDNLFGKIVAIALVCVAVFNAYILWKYPGYRKMREKIAQEEDKRIEAKISKQVKKQAINQLTKN